MPAQRHLITDSTTVGLAVNTTNCLSDKKLLFGSCMSWHRWHRWHRWLSPKTLLIIYIFVLFRTSLSLTATNHLSESKGQLLDGVQKQSDSIAVNDKSTEKSKLSIQSSRSSLPGLNQLRMITERAVPRNVTAQIGHPVYLHCIVEPIGDKMVSWIRLRDFHVLTVGLQTYIRADDRFVIRHGTLHGNDWALQIKHVLPSDEGLYECQINSDPPRSQYYYLQVVVPLAQMVGYPDMFVRTGAVINLTCIISRSPEPPAFVFWYHNDRMINYDYNSISRGDITVQKDSSKSDSVISRLVIRSAKLHDSGNYTCAASNAEPTSLYVHVLQGEKRLSSRIQNDEAFIEPNTSDTSAGTALTDMKRSFNIVLTIITIALQLQSIANLAIVT